jgi:hypothetical protein
LTVEAQALVEREHLRAATAFPPAEPAPMVHQDVPHQLPRHRQELGRFCQFTWA